MTKMWPPIYDSNKIKKSPGEKVVFDRLRNDITCEDWYVFYSFFLDNHESQGEGEVDFIVFIPHKGIVIVEVKSHKTIEYKNRQWILSGNVDERGPLEQANGNKWSLVNLVKDSEKKPESWSKVPITHVAIFPNAKFNLEGLEYESWRVCDSNRVSKGISSFLLNAINEEIKDNKSNYEKRKNNSLWQPKLFDKKYMNRVVSIISPEISAEIETSEERKLRINKEIDELTPRQKEAIHSAENNRKILIDGLAGTGKTIIATELAGRASDGEEKVCYICYNKGLGSFISDKYKDFAFDVFSIDKLLLHVSTFDKPPLDADTEWWRYTLVENAFDQLIEKNIEYDYLVIDEFQDLAAGLNFMFLDRLLKGGFASGKWTLLGDLENQNLYNNPSDLKNFLTDNLGDSFLNYTLKINCRNTPSTVEFVEHFTKVSYFDTLRNEGLQAPRNYIFEDEVNQKNKVNFLLDNLYETYDSNEILFLTPSNSTFISTFNENNSKYQINEFIFDSNHQNKTGPFYTTIKKFKGLEFNVVILVDMKLSNYQTKSDLKNEVYTGLTRSLETTCIFFDQDAENLLLGGL